MPKYTAKQSVGHFKTGEEVTGLTDKRAKVLLEAGAIELLDGDGDDAPTDYSKMTVAELKETAEAQGKEYDANARKDDLIKLLEG